MIQSDARVDLRPFVRAWIGRWLCAALLLGSASCDPAARPPVNLVLITIDTLRADHVGARGGNASRTPILDGLAAKGVRFSRATTVSNNTLPAHVSMFSGRHPQSLGVPRNGYPLPADVPWLPEFLRGAGYDTAAFISAAALTRELGLSRGFATYDQSFPVREMDQRQRRGAATVDAAIEWLHEPRRIPFFLWVHLFDPHYPYTPPAPFDEFPPYDGPADGSMEYLVQVWGRLGYEKIETTEQDRRHLVERYDGEIAYADFHLGRLLSALEEVDGNRGVMVVFAADHGESLTEHDYLFDHGEYLYQPSLHIPLVVVPPESWEIAPRVSGALAQTLDVFPTLLSAAGLAVPEGTEGRDLEPALRGEATIREIALAESCRPWRIEKDHPGEYRNLYKATSALRWPWKLIATPFEQRLELYDLESDPGELSNRADSNTDVVNELAAAIEEWRDGRVRLGVPDLVNMERIRALGYAE